LSWEDVFKLVLAAVFAGTATITITWLKSLWDEQRALNEIFSKALREAADLAAKYWLTEHDDKEVALLEAKLVGAQTYLSHLRIVATAHFRRDDRMRLIGNLADLYDRMTSGGFKGKGRPLDPERADDCQRLAGEIAIFVLSAQRRSMNTGHLLRRALRLNG
jgi:hypothetical protein